MFYSQSTGGFYDPAVHGKHIPADAIEITRAAFRALLDGQAQGKQIRADDSGRPVLVEPPRGTAADRRIYAKSTIDAAAGNARGRFITMVPGQETIYQLKANEAHAFITAGRPVETTAYTMLTAEAEARSMAVSDLADEILATQAVWVQAAARIEQARVAGKAAINAAPDDADFAAVAQPWIEQLAALRP